MRAHLSDMKIQDFRKIDKIREGYGLRIIKVGKRECLACSRKFHSEDLATQRMCGNCRKPDPVQVYAVVL